MAQSIGKSYRGKLSIKERLQEESPSFARIWQDRRDALREIERLEEELLFMYMDLAGEDI